jgi:hypothetical protein
MPLRSRGQPRRKFNGVAATRRQPIKAFGTSEVAYVETFDCWMHGGLIVGLDRLIEPAASG